MHFTSETRLNDGIVERTFTLGEIPGILWTPENPLGPRPLVLMGHPGDLRAMYPRLLGRARRAIADGFAAASIEQPGSGERPPIAPLDQARAELRATIQAGGQVGSDLVDRLVLPLVDQAAPEWQEAIDALAGLPEIGGTVGYSGGNISIGVRLARTEPRIAAVGYFAGSFVPDAIVEEARSITIPAHFLLQWDDEFNDRQAALDLFDALGSSEKTLQANLGGHTGVPSYAGEDAARFFLRHLK